MKCVHVIVQLSPLSISRLFFFLSSQIQSRDPLNTKSPFPVPHSHLSAFCLYESDHSGHSYKWDHTVLIALSLPMSLTVMFPDSFGLLAVSEFPLFLWLRKIPLYAESTFCLSVHLSDGHLDHFYLLAFVNSAARHKYFFGTLRTSRGLMDRSFGNSTMLF